MNFSREKVIERIIWVWVARHMRSSVQRTLLQEGRQRLSLLAYSTLEGHNSNLFLSQLELLPGFPAEMPYAVLSA